ncbi:conserved hypothetical protein [Xenorhabdus bovienii str. feltiae Florida]|nr:conserved hypothetical protein [Xenorhabdus bovienii str. feltiae France]CDG91728.1 conserved hypothetical protein [Xenorhabdus bovienii str. feltiae Florida]
MRQNPFKGVSAQGHRLELAQKPGSLPEVPLMRQNLSEVPPNTLSDNIGGIMQATEGFSDQ